MSFILDALKKSENERQGQRGLGVAEVPVARDAPGAPAWIWWLLVLLGVNVVVLLAVLLRAEPESTDAGSDAVAATETPPPAARPAPDRTAAVPETVAPELAAVVGRARAEREQAAASSPPSPVPAEPEVVQTSAAAMIDEGDLPSPTAGAAASVPDPPPAAADSAADGGDNALALPTLDELRAGGATGLPDLHLDIHVWSEQPRGRFVYVNTVKYREGDELADGPRVASIVREGVVLEHRGSRFLLPRE